MSFSRIQIKSEGKFLKIESGQPHDLRLLDEAPVEKMQHGFGKEAIHCTGDTCLKCVDGDAPKQRFAVNVYDYNSKKVLIWEFGASIAKQLKAIDGTLEEEGKKIIQVDLKVDATGSNQNKKYSVTPRMTSKIVPDGLILHKLDVGLPF